MLADAEQRSFGHQILLLIRGGEALDRASEQARSHQEMLLRLAQAGCIQEKLGQSGCCQFHFMSDSPGFYRSSYILFVIDSKAVYRSFNIRQLASFWPDPPAKIASTAIRR